MSQIISGRYPRKPDVGSGWWMLTIMLHKESLWLGFPVWYLGFGFAIENKTMASLIFLYKGVSSSRRNTIVQNHMTTRQHGNMSGNRLVFRFGVVIGNMWLQGNLLRIRGGILLQAKGSRKTNKKVLFGLRSVCPDVYAWERNISLLDLGGKILEKKYWRKDPGGKI